MLDIATWVEQRFSRWRWTDLLATLAISAILLYGLGTLVPERLSTLEANPVARGNSTIYPLLLDRRDNRGFRVPPPDDGKDDTFDLLLISDSAMLVKDAPPEHQYRGQPQYSAIQALGDYVKSVNGKRLVIHEYFNTGMRSGDLRRIVLRAVNDPRIDAAVININLLMTFNDWMPFGIGSNRLTVLDEPGATIDDALPVLATARPSGLLFKAAAAIWPFYDSRFPIFLFEMRPLNRTYDSWMPFPFYETPKGNNPWMIPYWMQWLYPPDMLESARRALRKYMGYTQMMMLSDLSERGFGVRNLRANLHTIKDWGKPTVLFVPPFAAAYASGPDRPIVDLLTKRIEGLAQQVDVPNLHLVTSTVNAAAPDWLYFDGYHARQADVAIRLVADMLETELGLKIERGDMRAIFPDAKPASPSVGYPPR